MVGIHHEEFRVQSGVDEYRDVRVNGKQSKEFASSIYFVTICTTSKRRTRVKRIFNAYTDDRMFSIDLVGAVRLDLCPRCSVPWLRVVMTGFTAGILHT
jgi:hypothetical protein